MAPYVECCRAGLEQGATGSMELILMEWSPPVFNITIRNNIELAL